MSNTQSQIHGAESKTFDAEIGQLLKLVISSIYTNKEIFVRELISNASDAIDKLRNINLQSSNTHPINTDFHINLSIDKEARTIKIEDNGIGLSKDDMINLLSKIAKSGTKDFADYLAAQQSTSKSSKDEALSSNLIGQFGVGFYSGFMVADNIEVISKKYDNNNVCVWWSDGTESYNLKEYNETNLDQFKQEFGNKYGINFENSPHGTAIILHIKETEQEFLDQFRIKNIVKTYSDNILYPINYLDKASGQVAQINSGAAIWTRAKSDISDEEHSNFFKSISHDPNGYLAVLHNHNEGKIEFINLLYLPNKKSHDTYHPDRLDKLKLYINRVFIAEDNINLIPKYLRFVRGVVDCPSLPLNISRETLQDNNIIHLIRENLEKKILSKLKELKNNDYNKYTEFWSNFGPLIKEGLCEYTTNHEHILKTCLFYSTQKKRMISLDEYLESSNYIAANNTISESDNSSKQDKDLQNATTDAQSSSKIYYIVGDEKNDVEFLAQSSHVENIIASGKDVLVMTDAVDAFWTTVVHKYGEHELVSATQAEGSNQASKPEQTELCKQIQDSLKKYNVEVRSSKVMVSSCARLVDDGMMRMSMERFLIKNNQKVGGSTKKVMEINESHPHFVAINSLFKAGKHDDAADAARLIFFQASLAEGYQVDQIDFKNTLDKVLGIWEGAMMQKLKD